MKMYLFKYVRKSLFIDWVTNFEEILAGVFKVPCRVSFSLFLFFLNTSDLSSSDINF